MSNSGGAGSSGLAGEADAGASGPAVPERRQITVMFCDLVGSTALSHVLDPEDLRDVLRAYQEACSHAVERYGGAVTRFMGDGILVLFGYPVAYEDSTVRAVHAALEMVQAIGHLHASGRFGSEVSLQVRIGLATGLTVVGDIIGSGPSREESVVGETPNLAARLQSLAAPNQVIISAATRALSGEQFDYQLLGERALKGLGERIQVWRVVGVRDPAALMDAVEAPHEPPLVNREREQALLARLWRRVGAGNGQVAVISGEPGIGKSRLVRVLRAMVREGEGGWLRLQCLPYFSNSTLHPVSGALAQLARLEAGDAAAARRDRIEEAFGGLLYGERDRALSLIADLLGVAAGGAPAQDYELGAAQRKRLLLDTLVELMLALSRRRPLALVVEDAQWMDPTTGEFLDQLKPHIASHALLLVVTRRPSARHTLDAGADATQLELARLHPLENQAIVEGVAGSGRLSAAVVQAIVSRTDGVPLFVEELTRTVLASGGRMDGDTVPVSLKDSLMARIDRLGPAKGFAQLASVLGQQFSRALVRAVSGLDAPSLDAVLDHLVEANILVPRPLAGGRQGYQFRHALVRDAAYESQLRRRREVLHGRAGDVLEAKFAEVVASSPELVAQHFAMAKRYREAARRWIDAGRRAGERSANREAVSHLRRGQAMLAQMQDNPQRDRLELELLNLLGPALIATEGGGSEAVTRCYTRALALCDTLPQSPQHFEAHWGWWRVSINHDIGRSRAQRLLELADVLGDPGLELQAHHCQWATLFHLGEHERCLQHVRRGLALYDASQHRHQAALYGGHDARVCAEGEQALSLWLQGHGRQAQAPLQRAMAWASELKHVGSMAHARDYAVILALYRRDTAEVREQTAGLLEFAEAQRLPDYAQRARFFDAWAEANDGDPAAGLSAMGEAVASLSRTGTREDFPMFYQLMVQVMVRLGQHRDALALLLDSFRESKRTGMRFWLAEQHRSRGELLRLSGAGDEAVQHAFDQSLAVAAAQGARAFALRAAVSLARLHLAGSRSQQARSVLARELSALGGFAAGRDVDDARALLRQVDGA